MADLSPLAAAGSPDREALLAKLAEANARCHRAELRVQQLEERLRLLAIAKYGPRSENMSNYYLDLFEGEPGMTLDEVAAEAGREPLAEPVAVPAPAARKRRPHPGRQTLPAELPRQIRTIACPPAQCTCGRCGAATTVIGYEESERLDMEPVKLFVLVTRREKRACSQCKQAGVVTAPVPAPIVEKGLASDRLVIQTVVAKYGDHTPLYRQSAILSRDAGVEISRVTLNGWVMRVGELLAPVVAAMRREILAGSYIQADETEVPVQRPGEKLGKNHQAYLWQFGSPGVGGARCGPVVFVFDLGRSGAVAQRNLSGYGGILQTDGYAGYNHVGVEGLVHAGCWAHARRYFVDAVKANEKDGYALDLVRRMDELFAVDREAREAKVSWETRAEWRRERSAAIVAGIKARLESKPGDVLPQSRAGKGVRYGLGQWKRLVRFLEYPEIELSNNLAENSMRPAVLGRKNWIHVGSVEAGPKVAAILSVMESCRRLGVPVREYLGDVLPGLGDRKVNELAELTPSAWARRRIA
jgi:transposase